MTEIQASELILNPDGSVYHLNLKPENISNDFIFVGDQYRVDKIIKHFDSIEFTTQKREFKTVTGSYKGKRLSVISTGIGPDNIDIVLNELDSLVNIDLNKRTIKEKHTALNIVRIGTSGALQKEIPINSFLMSDFALDVNGMLRSYRTDEISHPDFENAFVKHTHWDSKKTFPLLIANSSSLASKINDEKLIHGITITAGGFYGPQGRVLRLALQDNNQNEKIDSFEFDGHKITNLEMETSAIYGLSKLLGHHAVSLNAIIANRALGTFSEQPDKVIEELILFTLDKLI